MQRDLGAKDRSDSNMSRKAQAGNEWTKCSPKAGQLGLYYVNYYAHLFFLFMSISSLR